MMSLLIRTLVLVVESVAWFMATLLLLRFYMQLFRLSFAQPFGRFVLQMTGPLVVPLRRIVPALRGLDLASLIPAYLLLTAAFAIKVMLLRSGIDLLAPSTLFRIFVSGLGNTLILNVYLLICVLFLQAFLSWIVPNSPLFPYLIEVTRPFLAPIRKVIPQISGIDLSPLVAILIAQIVLIFLEPLSR